MHVLHFSYIHPERGGTAYGGIASLMKDFCDSLIRSGCKIAIVNPSSHKERNGFFHYTDDGFELYFIPASRKGFSNKKFFNTREKLMMWLNLVLSKTTPSSLKSFFYRNHVYYCAKKIIKDFKPDIIHLHHNFAPGAIPYIKAAGNIPIVTTIHGIHDKDKGDITDLAKEELVDFRKNLRKVINGVNHVIFLSENNYLKSEKYICHTKNYSIIPNGINIENILPEPKSNVRNNFHINPSDFMVVFTGTFNKRKGLDIIMKSILMIRKENIKFILIGDGELYDWSKKFVRNYNLENKVLLTGSISSREKVFNYLSASDLFILPTKAEAATSISLLEAMALRLPIITTDPKIGSFIGLNDRNLFFLKEHNPKILAELILYVYKNGELAKEKSINAYNFLINHLIWDKIVPEYYIPLYKSMVSNSE